MKFRIISRNNTIIAEQAFVDAQFPGDYVLVPDDAAPSPHAVPQEITMRQARRVLNDAGMLAGIAAVIAGMPQPAKANAEIDWEYSNTVQRHNGLVAQLGPALGLTETQIDAMFVAAAQIL